jgi:Trk K+ transport system NAD-binding subunit
VLSILLLTVSAIILRYGFDLELLLVISLFLLFYIAYRLGKKLRFVLFQKITFQLSHAASQISIRGTLLLLFIFVALSQFLGEEAILLGAFMSGLLLSFFLHKERSLLLLKLDGMGFGFFIPIFFIMVGVKFDPGSLREFDESLFLFLGMMALVMFLVKVLPSAIWIRLFGWRRSLAGGFLMSARLGLVIAAASIGLQLNVITPGLNSSFIIMAVLTCLLSPVLYSMINRQMRYLEDKVVIVGGSSVGVLLARRLKMHGRSCVIIEKDEARFNEILLKGLQVVHADGLVPQTYKDIQLSPGNYVVVYTSSYERNLEICSILRRDLLHEKIISRPGNSKIESHLRQLGVEILDSRRVLATTIENLILRPTTYHALVDSFENYSVEDITITDPGIDGRQIKEIPFERDGMLILVTRGNDKDIPRGDTYLKTGDVITVFGTESAVASIRNQVKR